MWSPLDKVTAGAKSVELLVFRKYSNLMLEDAEHCESGNCDCVKKIGVFFVLYRFMVIVSYLLLLGGLWQLEVILRKTIRSRCKICQRKAIKVSKNACKNCSFTNREGKFVSLGNNSITEEIDCHSDSLDSSGDTIDENIHFVTYREEDTNDDGFQDDDYYDILTSSQFVVDDQLELEALLQQQEIDWDSPVPVVALAPSLNDSVQDELYFEEDFFTVLGVHNDFELLEIDEFFEDLPANQSCSLSSLTAPSHMFESGRTILDEQSCNFPTLDDDVLAAIVGKFNQEKYVPNCFETENEWFLMF